MLQTPHRRTPLWEASISSIQVTSHLLIQIWLDNLVEKETCWSFFFFLFKPGTVLFAGLGAVAMLALLIVVTYFRKCRNHSKAQPNVSVSNRDLLSANKATVSEKKKTSTCLQRMSTSQMVEICFSSLYISMRPPSRVTLECRVCFNC